MKECSYENTGMANLNEVDEYVSAKDYARLVVHEFEHNDISHRVFDGIDGPVLQIKTEGGNWLTMAYGAYPIELARLAARVKELETGIKLAGAVKIDLVAAKPYPPDQISNNSWAIMPWEQWEHLLNLLESEVVDDS